MSDDVTLNAQQLEAVIRKVVREELMAFATREQDIFYLDKESLLYEDMENILEQKKSNQLTFHNHEEVWHG